MAQTQVDLSTAEISEQLKVTPQCWNGWKRAASLKTGKTYGTKRGKAYYFTGEEVAEILDLGQSSDRSQNAPQQTWEAEDLTANEDQGYMILASQQQAVSQDLQEIMSMVLASNQAKGEALAEFLAPENQQAQILYFAAQKLKERKPTRISQTLGGIYSQGLLPPRIDPAFI